jgi:pyruvate dehydrogenase E1 component beta subunit
VITPSNPYDAKGLLKAAIRDDDPIVFMESERMYGDKGEVPEGEYIIPIGVADVQKKGKDVTLVSFGKIMKVVHEAAKALETEGISAEVIDLRTIRPLDIETILTSVKKTNRLVIIEESWPVASIASEISHRVQRLAFDYLDAPVQRVMMTDTPFAFAIPFIEESLPNVEKTVKAVKEVMYIAK